MTELIQVTLYTLEAELESLTAFDRWLDALSENLGDRHQIGRAHRVCNCPLAAFLIEELGMLVKVNQSGIELDDNGSAYYHTPLTRSFTGHIDVGRRRNEPITIATAKRALQAARKAIAGGAN